MTRTALTLLLIGGVCWAADAPKPKAGDAELVERVVSARKEYQQSLVALYDHYVKAGDREKAKWVED